MYDCIVILGGSLKINGDLPDWVINRLDEALLHKTKYYLLSSRGTPHKPPPLDDKNMPIDETIQMAKYLINKNINPNKILLESWSMDTIGNAYGVLTLHCIPRRFSNLLIITSDFHIQRSELIFKKVFSLTDFKTNLDFISTKSNILISDKERKSLETWIENSKKINTLEDLHNFIFLEHNAYCSLKKDDIKWSKKDLEMYCIN